jgi:hypothetical protein
LQEKRLVHRAALSCIRYEQLLTPALRQVLATIDQLSTPILQN